MPTTRKRKAELVPQPQRAMVHAFYIAAELPPGTSTRNALAELSQRLLDAEDILHPDGVFLVRCNPLGRGDPDPRMAVVSRAQW